LKAAREVATKALLAVVAANNSKYKAAAKALPELKKESERTMRRAKDIEIELEDAKKRLDFVTKAAECKRIVAAREANKQNFRSEGAGRAHCSPPRGERRPTSRRAEIGLRNYFRVLWLSGPWNRRDCRLAGRKYPLVF
jgi:hypothetical protein